METPRRVPNKVTLAGLRRLMEATKEKAGEVAININLDLWYYGNVKNLQNKNEEKIGVYTDQTGDGTHYFASLKEAHDYIKTLEKGGD